MVEQMIRRVVPALGVLLLLLLVAVSIVAAERGDVAERPPVVILLSGREGEGLALRWPFSWAERERPVEEIAELAGDHGGDATAGSAGWSIH